jgi:predicted transcriptional regulator of viral defense system/very-short-patch-repair endonuclease
MHDSRASDSTPPNDARIAALARSQHGVLSRAQLSALGVGRGEIAYRIKLGRLHRVHPAVYAVGHPILSLKAKFMAATLAVGDGAVLSHRSAAELHGLLKSATATIDVSARRRCPVRPAITTHQTRTLKPQDMITVDGIAITTVARTLLDLADVAPQRRVERALDQAEILRVFDLAALDDTLARANGRRGAALLRAAVEQHRRGPTLTRSELEEAFLVLVDEAEFDRPIMNTMVCGFEVDAYWPHHGLVVELDSFRYHRTRRIFESDRARDIALQTAGLRTARFTDRRINDEPAVVQRDLRALVDSGRPRSS